MAHAMPSHSTRGKPGPKRGSRSRSGRPRRHDPGWRSTDLTEREVEVVRLIANGDTNREIGETLSIARHTVHVYVERAMAKTGARNRTQLATLAMAQGIVPGPSDTEPRERSRKPARQASGPSRSRKGQKGG